MNYRIYNPDRWKLLKFYSDNTEFFKVLAGWSGGYLNSDNWRLSSVVDDIEHGDEEIIFINKSGSRYKCNRNCEGFTAMTSAKFNEFKEFIKETDMILEKCSIDDFKKENKYEN